VLGGRASRTTEYPRCEELFDFKDSRSDVKDSYFVSKYEFVD
jgi:hypothetical protein